MCGGCFLCAAGLYVKCSRQSWVISAYSEGEEAIQKLMKAFKGDNSTGTYLGIWKRVIRFGVGNRKIVYFVMGRFSSGVSTLRRVSRRVCQSHFPATLTHNQFYRTKK